MLTRQRARRTADRAGARAATRSSRRCRRRPCARRRRPRETRRSPISSSPAGCRPSSASSVARRRQALEVVRVADDGQAVAHERLAQRALAARRPSRSGSAATRWRTIFSAIWNASSTRSRSHDCERLLARVARRATSCSASCEQVDDGSPRRVPCPRRSRPRSPARARPARSPRPARARPRSALRPAARALEELVQSRRGCRVPVAPPPGERRAAAGVVRGGDGVPAVACPRRCARAMIGRLGHSA